MPNDVITLNAVAKELNDLLLNGRIEKIYQPEKDEICLQIKSNGSTKNLVISANPAHPRIHISSQKKENSYTAPAFCMLLRKYLLGSSVRDVEIYNCDRIIKISIDARNELQDKQKYFLMIELMGRYSNIILLNDDMLIIDAIKRIHLDQSTTRYILPNIKYALQPQTKISLNNEDKLKEFFEENKNNLTIDTLMQNISGISKDTAKELLASPNILESLILFNNINSSKKYKPCIYKIDNQIKDFYICPYTTLKGEFLPLASMNACFDYYYNIYDHCERKKANTKQITIVLKRLKKKIDKRINDNYSKIAECEKSVQLKEKGDLILSNLYKIKKQDKVLLCYDYNNECETEITLDPLLNPSENAQNYFKRYAKSKRAKDIALQQLPELEKQREYLDIIDASISNCELKLEYDEIMNELTQLGGMKKVQNKQKRKPKPSMPTHIVIKGFDIYIGKNSIQNVETTFNIGNGGDIWLHTKDYHGCHAIIKGTPDDDTIYKVACIVAYYSEGRTSDKVNVDYTLRKFVKKQPNSFIGMVNYTNYKTVLVPPTSIEEIKNK
ncbi:MAG: NFACT family protein [Clostridia bacterium]